MTACRSLPLVLFLVCTLAAQDAEPASIGVQARISKAESGLKDVTGSALPGLGASLVVEMDYTEGFRARVDIGYDQWQTGDLGSRPGAEGSVSAFHVGVEGVMMLNPDEAPSWGPYVLAGLGAYAWNVQERDKATGVTTKRRGTHAAGTLGIGFRLAKSLDLELKILAGSVAPNLKAAALQVGVTYRFMPSF
jgi:hypothetical protein